MSAKSCLKTAVALVCVAIGLTARLAAAQLADFSGRPIVDLIEALRDQGARIVYSADSLPTRLRVTVTPTTSDTLDGLREILAPHGLDVELGPRDTWLVVRRAPVQVDTPEGSTPPPLTLIPPTLETVIVTASRYPIDRQSAVSSSSIGRKSIETTPVLGQDPLRITHRLPGVSSDQLTSRTHVRGGELDEVLLMLDGVQLYSPYHLKDFQSIFSSIDPRIIESMDVRTGGYEARYGGKMSGVIDIQSIRPTEFRHHEIGVSLLDTSILSSGLFNNGRGAWVTSVRRSNLDVISETGDADIGAPQYVDFFSKLEFSPSPATRIAASVLSLDDKITLKDPPEATATADYDDLYFWLSLDRSAASGLESSYRLATANLNRARDGEIDDIGKVMGALAEGSSFDRVALTAEWTLSPSDSVRINWGAGLAQQDLAHAVQSFRNDVVVFDAPDLGGPAVPPADADIRLDQQERTAHLSLRYQPLPRLVTELGLRWDDQSLTDENQTSPRFNLLFDITPRTSLRLAWGEFSQSDSLSELPVADGEISPQLAEESSHSILGLDHAFGDSGLFRVEVYEKKSSNPNFRFENIFERVSLVPELLPDRFIADPSSATTRGIEWSVEGAGDRFSWWLNVALARTKERLSSGWFRRSWDERRSMKAGGEWTGRKWIVTTNLSYRSGWPISNLALSNGILEARDYNAVRLPDFSSADIRASRSVELRQGALNWYIEVSNLLDHSNFCCVAYQLTAPDTLSTEYDGLLGRVPNLGLRWQF